MRSFVERTTVFLVALVMLLWGGYHVLRYTKDSLVMETVFQDTVPRSLEGRGIAIRQEQLLEKSSGGTPHFLYSDGTRIGIGQPVAEYYSGNVNNGNIQRIRELEEEIHQLEDAQNKNLNNYASAPGISRDIREQFATLTQVSTTGHCEDLPTMRNELEVLVNRRQIATGKSDNFEGRISSLKSELGQLRTRADLNSIKQGYTPVSGYFAKNTDGYEARISPHKMEEMEIEDFVKLVEEPVEGGAGDSGRIVTSSKWYFAVTMPVQQTEWLTVGQRASLTVDGSVKQIPARVSKLLVKNNQDTAVVILSSDIITEDIINLRVSDVTLSFSQFTGLRINSSSIKFQKNEAGVEERGVYVLENYVVRFKKIDPIYEEQSFVLSKLNYSDSKDQEAVRLFDQVIVRGNDLYDGKPIQ